jgi:hypothetical protein
LRFAREFAAELPAAFACAFRDIQAKPERRCEIPYVSKLGARRAPQLTSDIARGVL